MSTYISTTYIGALCLATMALLPSVEFQKHGAGMDWTDWGHGMMPCNIHF